MISMSNRGWKQAALAGIRLTAILSTIALLATPMKAQSLQAVPSATKAAGTGANGFSGDSGSASGTRLSGPAYNVFDTQGNQYFSDAGNNCVRRVDPSGGITTVAGLNQPGLLDTCDSSLNPNPTSVQGLLKPQGVAMDVNGNLYVADTGHNCVRMLGSGATSVANMVTVAGICDQPTASAITPVPTGVAIDLAGNLYVSTSDGVTSNQVVRHRPSDPAATVCRVAGNPSATVPGACLGTGTLPTLNKPSGLAFDPIGNLVIADTGNSCVREMTPAFVFTTPVGSCTNDSTGTSIPGFANPVGVTFGQTGKLYITAGNKVFQFVLPSQLTLIGGLASGASAPYAASQDGAPAITVPLSAPEGIAVDPLGNVFIADTQNNILRKLAANFHFPNTAVLASSSGQSVFFEINSPVNLTTTVGSDYKILSSTCNGALTPSSTPTTCAVSVAFTPTYPGARRWPLTLADSVSGKSYTWGLDGLGTGAQATFPPGIINTVLASLANPSAVRLDSKNNVYFAEAGTSGNGDVKFIPAGSTTPSTLIASGAGLNTPTALALDSAGNLYIADKGTGSIFKFDVNGTLTTFASGFTDPEALAIDNFDNLYIADSSTHAVTEIFQGGQQTVVTGTGIVPNPNGVQAVKGLLVSPSGLAVEADGTLDVSDSGGHRVYAVDTQHVIHFLVGNGTTTDTAPGTALGTALQDPRDLAIDAAGDVYIADGTSNRSILVYSSTQQNPQVTTIAGTGTPGNGGDGGPGNAAQLNNPVSLALAGNADLYIVDLGNEALREIVYSAPVLDFGTIKAGQVSPTLSITLWDTGNVDLIQVAQLLLSDTTNFSLVSTNALCGSTVLAGATCDYSFQFNPQSIGTYSATATLTDNAYDSPQVITLKGIATIPNTAPSTITTTQYIGTYGTPYTWAAGVVGDGTHTPTGTLTFVINGANLCPPATLDNTVHASCSPSSTALAAGSYTMVINYSGDSFYAANSITAPATILPRPVTIKADSFTRPYGQPNPVLTGTITGVVPGETITATYSTTATQYSAPGVYPIVPVAAAGPGTSLSNYVITLVNGTLTITQAGPVTIAVDNAQRIYGVPNPTFTSTITNGAPGDTVTVTYSTTAVLNSPVGTYPITATLSGNSANNYSGSTVIVGTLTITKAPTTTTLTSSGDHTAPGAPVTFTAVVTSPSEIIPDGAVTFTDNGTVIGTVTLDANGHATITTSSLTVGAHTITATYPGTSNFLGSSASLTQNVGVPGTFTITATPPYQEVKGAGSNVYQVTVTSTGGFYGDVTLSCAGLPSDAGCVFTPATVTLTAGGTATATLTTTTTLADATTVVANLPAKNAPGTMPLMAWTMFPMQLSGAATIFAGGIRRRKNQTIWKRIAYLLPMILLVLGLSGCGCTVTQFHTYTITITGTNTSGGAPLTQTATVSLSAIQ